jgi:hypothetical protein
MVSTPGWIKEWRQRRQSKNLSKKLHRRLQHAGGVRQLILNNVRLNEGALRSITESVQESYRAAAVDGQHLQSLTVRDCFLKDDETIRVLIGLIQRERGNLERVSLINNSVDADHSLNKNHLIRFADALGVVKHICVGQEFMTGTESARALSMLCARAITLQMVNFPFGVEEEELPREVPSSIRLRGLYKGIKSRECRVQTLILQGLVMDDNRFALLVDALHNAKASTPVVSRRSNLTIKHLKLSGHCLHSRSCRTLIRLMAEGFELETIDMESCGFLSAITEEESDRLGQCLAKDGFLTKFSLRDVHLADKLAVPLFQSLRTNVTLLHLALPTRFDKERQTQFPPVSTTGYQALLEVLPNLTRLQSLHLGRDFFFGRRMLSSSGSAFIDEMKNAINHNKSILEYEGGEVPTGKVDHSRYGHFCDIIPRCMERNRAILVAESMLMVAYDVRLSSATWHAAVLHMAAKVDRQSALYLLLHRVLTDPQVPLHRDVGQKKKIKTVKTAKTTNNSPSRTSKTNERDELPEFC